MVIYGLVFYSIREINSRRKKDHHGSIDRCGVVVAVVVVVLVDVVVNDYTHVCTKTLSTCSFRFTPLFKRGKNFALHRSRSPTRLMAAATAAIAVDFFFFFFSPFLLCLFLLSFFALVTRSAKNVYIERSHSFVCPFFCASLSL